MKASHVFIYFFPEIIPKSFLQILPFNSYEAQQISRMSRRVLPSEKKKKKISLNLVFIISY
jgi:hypothetical protein